MIKLSCVAVLMTATSAHAGTWQLTSGDALNDDAIVSGFFTGTDTNNDGRLTEPELSAWQFDFSPGSTGLEPFSLQSTQPSDVLLFFLYNFANDTLSQFRVAGAAGIDFVAGSILIVVDPSVGVFTQNGVDLVTTKVIPIPPALWMLGSALSGVAGMKRKRRR